MFPAGGRPAAQPACHRCHCQPRLGSLPTLQFIVDTVGIPATIAELNMSSNPGPWYAAMSGACMGPTVSFGAVVCVLA